jgi:hypothetical protein
MALNPVSIPLIITKDQKQQLLDLGYKKAQINKMTPEEAHKILGIEPEASPDPIFTGSPVEIPEKFQPPVSVIEIPSNPDAEKSLIGGLLFNQSKELWESVTTQIVPGHLHLESHQKIYQGMVNLFERGELPNLVTVIDELKKLKQLKRVGGEAYVAGLVIDQYRRESLAGEVRLIRSTYQARHLLYLTQRIQKRIFVGDDGEEIALGIQIEIDRLVSGIGKDSDFVSLSSLEILPVEWLWFPRIPLYAVTMIEGEEGIGKSTMVCEIAAAFTNGGGLKDFQVSEPGNILWLAAEDDHARTLKPRLLSANANCERIIVKKTIFKLDPKGLSVLRAAVKKYESSLVIIDPIISYCDGDPNKAEVARATTNALTEIAQELHCTFILLRHIGKSKGGGDPRAAGLYSIEWRAAVRSSLLVGKDPDDESIRAVTHTKHNLSEKAESLGYEIRNDITSPAGARFFWTGKSELTAERILQKIAEDDEERTYRKEQKIEASEFALDLLADGPIPQANIKSEAQSAGVSYRTLERIKHSLGIKSFSTGNGKEKVWYWQLNGNHGGSETQPKLVFEAPENRSEDRQMKNSGGLPDVESSHTNTLWKTPKTANSEKCVSSDPQANTANGGLRKKSHLKPLESNSPKTAKPIISGGLRNSKKRVSEDEIIKTHCPECGSKLETDGSCDYCSRK